MGTLEIRQLLSVQKFVPTWSPLQRIQFRFVFAYLVLFGLFGGNSLLLSLWDPVVRWVGAVVFQVNITYRITGSGDTTWNYVQLFCFLVLSVAATGIWTLLDRKRINYEQCHLGLRVFIRFSLALSMIVYGTAKVIPVQMPSPSLERLLEPYGNSSPMGILWTFMGASAGYSIFTGAAELLGGLLLTTRRTTLLGALVCLGVMGNVMMLNFCYDVPVKILSTHLVLMAVFLIAPDLRRLGNMFLFGRRVEAVAFPPTYPSKALERAALIVRTVFVGGLTLLMLLVACIEYQMYANPASQPPLYGIWNVEEIQVDGKVQPPLLTDATQWRRLVFHGSGTLGIHLMNDTRKFYTVAVDEAKHTLTVTKLDNKDWQATLNFTEITPGLLTLEGTFDGHTMRVTLRRFDETQFLLTSRGFHWINEIPFNK